MTKELLIVFVKNPQLGKVKTRLAKSIGEEAALAIYLKLLAECNSLTEQLNCDAAIYYNDYIDSEDLWDNREYKKRLQRGVTLGDKMYNAISDELAFGYEHVCLVGSDIHSLSKEIIEKGFLQLKTKDVVIGPAADGGYYLIGMNKANKSIFDLPAWSTSEVFKQTIELINNEGLTYGQTPLLNDIDDYEDLKKAGLH